MPTGIAVSRIIIVQSLGPGEVQTGSMHAAWLRALVDENAVGIGVELVDVAGASAFRGLMRELVSRAQAHEDWPILHIECHGSKAVGLSFADGTLLSWEAFGGLLAELNVATGFNLLVLVSACYGAYLAGQFSPVHAAPAWGIIAPTRTVNPSEILSAFRTFYSRFAKTLDLGVATADLTRTSLSEGSWFWELAEQWFETLIVAFARKRCSKNAIRHWARTLSHKMRQAGVSVPVRTLEHQLAAHNAQELTGKYFDRFFCVAELPANKSRFEPVRQKVQRRLDELHELGLIAR